MYLAAVKELPGGRSEAAPEAPLPSARWQHFPYSCLSHHGGECCEVAREWIVASDFDKLNGGDLLTGIRWLLQRY